MVDRVLQGRLSVTLDDYLAGYEERKLIFGQFPKYNIPLIFDLWDQYLAFLTANTKQEAEARRIFEEYHPPRKGLKGIRLTGGFDDLIKGVTDPVWKGFNQKLKDIFPHEGNDEIITLTRQALNDPNLYKFFVHDLNHLIGDLNRQWWCLSEIQWDYSIERMRDYRDEIRGLLELFNADPEYMYGTYIQPFKMLDFIVCDKLGRRQRTEIFSPADLARKTWMILQARCPQFKFGLTTKLTDEPRNELAIDVENVAMYGNSGVVFSIIYNLVKNAYKKLVSDLSDEERIGYDPSKGFGKIYVQVYEAPLESVVITVGDTGKPIDLDKMKNKIRTLIHEQGIESVVFLSQGAKKRYENWQASAYKVGELSMKDITDVAFMARMSGFDNNEEMSSGMGLYGLQYFVKRMGGFILYGENFETGSPIFTCVLPKNMSTGKFQRVLNLVSTGYTAARLYEFGHDKEIIRKVA
ncbi:hypothetical protein HYY69_01235 [Candidatus Woesearchaeota archaeon]|nr:hypothetical protein [Candidatus Woesearchaeota archaeon]